MDPLKQILKLCQQADTTKTCRVPLGFFIQLCQCLKVSFLLNKTTGKFVYHHEINYIQALDFLRRPQLDSFRMPPEQKIKLRDSNLLVKMPMAGSCIPNRVKNQQKSDPNLLVCGAKGTENWFKRSLEEYPNNSKLRSRYRSIGYVQTTKQRRKNPLFNSVETFKFFPSQIASHKEIPAGFDPK